MHGRNEDPEGSLRHAGDESSKAMFIRDSITTCHVFLSLHHIFVAFVALTVVAELSIASCDECFMKFPRHAPI